MSILSPAARLSHGLSAARISGRHCSAPSTARDESVLRTTTTRWSLEKAGTVDVVSIAIWQPMTPNAESFEHLWLATRTASTSPIVTRLRATLNSWTSLFANDLSDRTTVHESPGGIGKYQFWNFGSVRSAGTPAFPMRWSVIALPSALTERTVMNQSSTNEFGFENVRTVLVTAPVPVRTSSGVTSYVSGRMSGVAAAVGRGAVGVARYAGASTLQAVTAAVRSALARTRRIAEEPNSPAWGLRSLGRGELRCEHRSRRDGRVDRPEHARALGVLVEHRGDRNGGRLERREADEPSVHLSGDGRLRSAALA